MSIKIIRKPKTTPEPSASSSASSAPPQIGTSTVTAVVSPAALDHGTKVSDNAMQELQRQQTRPTAASALSTDRVSIPTEIDWRLEVEKMSFPDLNHLLDETFKALALSSSSSSTSSAAQALSPVDQNLDNILNEADIEFSSLLASSSSSTSSAISNFSSFGWPWDLLDIEKLMVGIIAMPVLSLLSPQETRTVAQSLNVLIEHLNCFFKSFVTTSESPTLWLEREKEKPFFWCTRPFGTSCFLITHLDQATDLTPHLDKTAIKEWEKHYQQSVEKLKEQHLDSYNETEFPFSEETKLILPTLQMMIKLNQNPAMAEWGRHGIQALAQNPQFLQQQIQALAQNPQFLQQQLQALTQNPQLMQQQIQALAQNPQLMQQQIQALAQNPQLLQQQIQALGENPSAELSQSLQPTISFFEQLDKVLQKPTNNTPTVQAWLEEQMKDPTYSHHFYKVKRLIKLSTLTPSNIEITSLVKTYTSCCDRLRTLGLLQSYENEGPSTEDLEGDKYYRDYATSCLSTLNSLSEEFKKLKPGLDATDDNRKTIEDWIANAKASEEYSFPFIFCSTVLRHPFVFEEMLEEVQLKEINKLYPFCRDQLTALGLNKYLVEHSLMGKMITSSTPAATPPKTLSDLERFKQELGFFREMLKQEDKTLATWLEENSPNSDYPLLWAKKRWPQRSHFRAVDMEIRRDWSTCADACFEKLEETDLESSYADITQIPADASPELREFLSKG